MFRDIARSSAALGEASFTADSSLSEPLDSYPCTVRHGKAACSNFTPSHLLFNLDERELGTKLLEGSYSLPPFGLFELLLQLVNVQAVRLKVRVVRSKVPTILRSIDGLAAQLRRDAPATEGVGGKHRVDAVKVRVETVNKR